MAITINAIVRNAHERSGMLSLLAAAGVAPMAIRTTPAGTGRFLRPGMQWSGLGKSMSDQPARARKISPVFMHLAPFAGIVMGLLSGVGGGMYVVFHPAVAGVGLPSGALLVAGLMALGWATGMIIGMALRTLAVGVHRRNRKGFLSAYERQQIAGGGPEEEPILVAITADNAEQAMTVETLLVRNGAQDVHLAGIDG